MGLSDVLRNDVICIRRHSQNRIARHVKPTTIGEVAKPVLLKIQARGILSVFGIFQTVRQKCDIQIVRCSYNATCVNLICDLLGQFGFGKVYPGLSDG